MTDISQIAASLTTMEREWIIEWQGAKGAAYNAVAGDLRHKGLVRGRLNWTLSETGDAVLDYLKDAA